MTIKNIKFLEHIRPNISCGTGYSEPDKFEVETTKGIKYNIYVDTWYVSDEADIKKIFIRALKYHILEGDIDNIEEAYKMYQREMKNMKL